jgi:tRNA 2-thiouridine synthesizing protein A
MSVTVLDVKGLSCPLPILRARKAMKDMAAGAVIEVLATDPGSVKDFAAFCQQTGNRLVGQEQADGVYTFRIEKA